MSHHRFIVVFTYGKCFQLGFVPPMARGRVSGGPRCGSHFDRKWPLNSDAPTTKKPLAATDDSIESSSSFKDSASNQLIQINEISRRWSVNEWRVIINALKLHLPKKNPSESLST
jgi:hypothetical protein